MLAPIYTVAQIRALEAAALKADPKATLMARAGLAAAKLASALVSGRGKNVLIVAGPGNNGGDAFEVALHLKKGFFNVSVVFAGDPATLPADAARALAKWRDAGGELLAETPRKRAWQLVVDGLFGIGLARPIAGLHAKLIEEINAIGAPVLALDIPSGINGDTGTLQGVAVRATHTITFIAHKPGLLTLDGPDHCGALSSDPLELDVEALLPAEGRLLDAATLHERPTPRPRNFHKGSAGSLAILGGASGMVGAAILAGRAALKTGAGKVFLGCIGDQTPAVDYMQPELMIRRADQVLPAVKLEALAVGPGMGTDSAAQRLLTQALRADVPIVVDADGLNLLATYSTLATGIATRTAPTLITPHPAEAARLLETDVRAVQANRLATARELAKRYKSHVVLKGNGSVLASPDGRWWINGSGNPGMASAGMGDVLSGMLGALLAQGLAPDRALRLGVYLHGAAADACVAAGIGPLGLAASELVDRVRELMNQR
jgi:hydroxyethylthiazole kinase-like uncharacterized protein yjeF